MKNFRLNVNQRIDVVSNKKEYKSIITDIGDDWIKINIPVYNDEHLLAEIDEVMEINVYFNSGRCYKFNAKVLAKEVEKNISCYKLSKAFNIKRIQRREYFRVEVLNRVYYKNITNCEENELSYDQVIMVDLSGNGVKLKIKGKVKKDDILSIKMKLHNTDIIVKGKVVRVEDAEYGHKLCGIKFMDITEDQIDKIMEELFTIMRHQRELT